MIWQLFHRRAPAALASTLLAASMLVLPACTEIVPGLNVRMNSRASDKYAVVPIDGGVLKELALERVADESQALRGTVPSDVPPEYSIGCGDIVYVTVWDHPELTTPSGPVTEVAALQGQSQAQYVQGRLVDSDGTIFFPYVGTFKIADMTTVQARAFIARQLARVVTNPQVDVRIVEFRAARVEVAGEVQRPGNVTLDDTPKGVLQAINLCGGLTANASRRRAYLVRGGATYLIDLAGLLSGERPVNNPLLKAGDVLHIPDPSADQVFVLGAVARQAPVLLRQSSMSLIEALTNAGGLEELRGKQSGVLIFRNKEHAATSIPTIYALDLSRPDGMLLAGEFALRSRDVVYVQATAFAQYNAVISTLLPTVSTIFELHELTLH